MVRPKGKSEFRTVSDSRDYTKPITQAGKCVLCQVDCRDGATICDQCRGWAGGGTVAEKPPPPPASRRQNLAVAAVVVCVLLYAFLPWGGTPDVTPVASSAAPVATEQPPAESPPPAPEATATVAPDAGTQYNAGLLQRELKQYSAAVAHFRESILIDPQRLEPRLALGDTLRDLKRYDMALGIYREALRYDPYAIRSLTRIYGTMSERSRTDASGWRQPEDDLFSNPEPFGSGSTWDVELPAAASPEASPSSLSPSAPGSG